MSKYYRVIKDHPIWEVGAILEASSNGYFAISDLWQKTLDNGKELDTGWHEGAELVENSSTWFERVYHVKGLGKSKYVTKKVAKALHNKDFKEV